MPSTDSRQPWALILGASSGFGEATAIALAAAGYDICGVHLDRRQGMTHVDEIKAQISRVHEASFGFYGTRKVWHQLRREGTLASALKSISELCVTVLYQCNQLHWVREQQTRGSTGSQISPIGHSPVF